MPLSNFKISISSDGKSILILEPKDYEYLNIFSSKGSTLIASTSNTIDDYAKECIKQFALNNGIERYLCINEAFISAEGAKITAPLQTSFIVMHFCSNFIELCLISQEPYTLKGTQIEIDTNLRIIHHENMPYCGLRSYLRNRYFLLITPQEEKRLLTTIIQKASCPHVKISGINPFIGVNSSMIFDVNEWTAYQTVRQNIICTQVANFLEKCAEYNPFGLYITGYHYSYQKVTEKLRQGLDSKIPITIVPNAENAVEQGFVKLHKSLR